MGLGTGTNNLVELLALKLLLQFAGEKGVQNLKFLEIPKMLSTGLANNNLATTSFCSQS
jgi:hypothetical protein